MNIAALNRFKTGDFSARAFIRSGLQRYGVAAALVVIAFLIRYFLSPVLGHELPFMFFLAAILLAAWHGGLGPGVAALFVGGLLGIHFIHAPTGTLRLTDPVEGLRILHYFVTAVLGVAVIEALQRSRLKTQQAVEEARRHAAELEREIAQRKQSQAALAEAKAQLSSYADELGRRVTERTAELQDSKAALEGVLYHIAHNLRAPLRGMEGFTSILLSEHGSELSPRAAEYARRVSEAAVRMDQLLQALLEYGRLEHLQCQTRQLSLEAVIESALSRLAETVKAAHAEITVERPLPEVYASASILELVLIHLLKNAIIFVPPWTNSCVHISAERMNDTIRLSVEDNGLGIDPEYHRRIFGVFERLHPTYPGLGIGLAIVAKGMQRMQGKVGLKSLVGKGSTFWLELPAANSNVTP
jgi:K+-sensing histidine kinase KdpD